jgi:hypothetical protein
MRLSLEIIQKYNFLETVNRVDWDDVETKFELPNGVILSALTIVGNRPTNVDTLYGFDESLQITTTEELDEILSMNFEQVLQKVADEDEDFNLSDWL